MKVKKSHQIQTLKKVSSKTILWITVLAIITSVFSQSNLSVLAAGASGYWTDYAATPDVSGSTYTIDSAEQLAWIAVQVNGGNSFTDCTISISHDIDLSGHYWIPIGNLHNPFSGVFEGNNLTIFNLTIGTAASPNSVDLPAGLFGYAENTVIQNVSINNAAVYSTCSIGGAYIGAAALAGIAKSANINNCSVDGIISLTGEAEGAADGVGGLVGVSGFVSDFSNITNCTSSCKILFNHVLSAGSLIGSINSSNLSSCYATGDVINNDSEDTSGCSAGGLVGGFCYGNAIDCSAIGNVTVGVDYAHAGGLVGTNDDSRIERCDASGNVSGYGDECSVGGLIGYSLGNFFGGRVSESYATGSVKGGKKSFVGGLVGNLLNSVSNCYATGNVTCDFIGALPNYKVYTEIDDNNYVGGLVGASSQVVIENSFATGAVTGYYFAGGLAGLTESGTNMINCYAAGTVNTNNDAFAGEFAGFCIDSAVSNCYWNSDAIYVNGAKKANPSGISEFASTAVSTDQYISSVEYKSMKDPSVPKTMEYMKSNEFVRLLNSYANLFQSYFLWKIDTEKNNGYPFLEGLDCPESDSIQSASPEQDNSITAVPTAASVQVDGKVVAFTAYNIDGSNYFKLRDLAMALNNTDKQFQVGWDNVNKAITLTNGEAYTAVGGELSASGNAESKTAVRSTSTVYFNGTALNLTAYTIDGNNYFKLRDVAQVIDFGVNYDSTAKAIIIDTTLGYIS